VGAVVFFGNISSYLFFSPTLDFFDSVRFYFGGVFFWCVCWLLNLLSVLFIVSCGILKHLIRDPEVDLYHVKDITFTITTVRRCIGLFVFNFDSPLLCLLYQFVKDAINYQQITCTVVL